LAKKLRSPTRTISNRGEREKYIGQWLCVKSDSPLVYDSIGSLYCGIYQEWRQEVAKIIFEPREIAFQATAELPAVRFYPDYEVLLTTGQVELWEAKYSRASLSEKERAKLELISAHCDLAGRPYHVTYRDELEQDGFIDTILLLRRYGHMSYRAEVLSKALSRLAHYPKAVLEVWRARADKARIPTGILYHLLYQQRLPLTYRRLVFAELQPCRV
jgi:hypothetical protein